MSFLLPYSLVHKGINSSQNDINKIKGVYCLPAQTSEYTWIRILYPEWSHQKLYDPLLKSTYLSIPSHRNLILREQINRIFSRGLWLLFTINQCLCFISVVREPCTFPIMLSNQLSSDKRKCPSKQKLKTNADGFHLAFQDFVPLLFTVHCRNICNYKWSP